MYTPQSIAIAFLFSIIAGLSTAIGSTVALFISKPKLKYLSYSLGLSAGVMLYVSFMELLPEGMESIGEVGGLLAFFGGLLLGGIIDRLLPEIKNPHHLKMYLNGEKECTEACEVREDQEALYKAQLMRTGTLTAVIIAIHNFPEGLATFGSSIANISLGVLVTIAIAIHNIPEGISVSIPIFYATGDKKKAFKYSFISGLAEPLGALIGFLVLLPFMSEQLLGGMLAFVAGIMIYISVDEIIPTAHNCGHGHAVLLGFGTGMLVMAISIILL